MRQIIRALFHAPRIVLERIVRNLDRISEPYREQQPDGGYCWQSGDTVRPDETQCRSCYWAGL